MSDPHTILIPRAAFAGLSAASSACGGVIAHDRDGLGIAIVMVRKGQSEALKRRMRERFGIDLPHQPRRAVAGDLALAGTGPGMWFATSDRSGNAFAASLAQTIGDLASVSDQSDGYAVLRLSGPKVRDALAKLVPIDVHPRAFEVGDVASTVAVHISATLWRLEDEIDGSPAFEIAVFRSYAHDFWHAVHAAAAEYGFATSP